MTIEQSIRLARIVKSCNSPIKIQILHLIESHQKLGVSVYNITFVKKLKLSESATSKILKQMKKQNLIVIERQTDKLKKQQPYNRVSLSQLGKSLIQLQNVLIFYL